LEILWPIRGRKRSRQAIWRCNSFGGRDGAIAAMWEFGPSPAQHGGEKCSSEISRSFAFVGGIAAAFRRGITAPAYASPLIARPAVNRPFVAFDLSEAQ